MEKQLFSVKESAEVLGIGLSLFHRMVNAGQIPVLRLGRRVLIRREDLERFGASKSKSA